MYSRAHVIRIWARSLRLMLLLHSALSHKSDAARQVIQSTISLTFTDSAVRVSGGHVVQSVPSPGRHHVEVQEGVKLKTGHLAEDFVEVLHESIPENQCVSTFAFQCKGVDSPRLSRHIVSFVFLQFVHVFPEVDFFRL